ncbi:hypothetical protein QTJ16_006931 [Diplocarpon rosae]|uniref:Uncharacterized protein n=1 Tax=Diplocarpon rosae TaxID=946125 RepID=A0AAD9SW18_9HELO|nr:hypothetical protein QTJ16_006931 [Diplocarpon rosae]
MQIADHVETTPQFQIPRHLHNSQVSDISRAYHGVLNNTESSITPGQSASASIRRQRDEMQAAKKDKEKNCNSGTTAKEEAPETMISASSIHPHPDLIKLSCWIVETWMRSCDAAVAKDRDKDSDSVSIVSVLGTYQERPKLDVEAWKFQKLLINSRGPVFTQGLLGHSSHIHCHHQQNAASRSSITPQNFELGSFFAARIPRSASPKDKANLVDKLLSVLHLRKGGEESKERRSTFEQETLPARHRAKPNMLSLQSSELKNQGRVCKKHFSKERVKRKSSQKQESDSGREEAVYSSNTQRHRAKHSSTSQQEASDSRSNKATHIVNSPRRRVRCAISSEQAKNLKSKEAVRSTDPQRRRVKRESLKIHDIRAGSQRSMGEAVARRRVRREKSDGNAPEVESEACQISMDAQSPDIGLIRSNYNSATSTFTDSKSNDEYVKEAGQRCYESTESVLSGRLSAINLGSITRRFDSPKSVQSLSVRFPESSEIYRIRSPMPRPPWPSGRPSLSRSRISGRPQTKEMTATSRTTSYRSKNLLVNIDSTTLSSHESSSSSEYVKNRDRRRAERNKFVPTSLSKTGKWDTR